MSSALTPLDFKFLFLPWHKHPDCVLELNDPQRRPKSSNCGSVTASLCVIVLIRWTTDSAISASCVKVCQRRHRSSSVFRHSIRSAY